MLAFREYESRLISPISGMILQSLNHSHCQEQRTPDQTSFETRLLSAKVLHTISHCQHFFSPTVQEKLSALLLLSSAFSEPWGLWFDHLIGVSVFQECQKESNDLLLWSEHSVSAGQGTSATFCPFIPSSLESQSAPRAECSLLICAQCRKTVQHWFSLKKIFSS